MNTLLDALLALQAQDDVVDALQKRLDALAPRLSELDVVRQRALKSIDETRAGVDAETRPGLQGVERGPQDVPEHL